MRELRDGTGLQSILDSRRSRCRLRGLRAAVRCVGRFQNTSVSRLAESHGVGPRPQTERESREYPSVASASANLLRCISPTPRPNPRCANLLAESNLRLESTRADNQRAAQRPACYPIHPSRQNRFLGAFPRPAYVRGPNRRLHTPFQRRRHAVRKKNFVNCYFAFAYGILGTIQPRRPVNVI